MRRSTLLWAFLGIVVVIGLFVVKHRVQDLEDRLHALNAEIITDRNAVQVMQAEWSYLNQPARLEALSKLLLGMDAPVAAQTVSMQELLQQSAPDAAASTLIANMGKAPPRITPPSVTPPSVTPPRTSPRGDTDWLAPILATLKKSQ